MNPPNQLFYRLEHVEPAYQLRYVWSGWPSDETFSYTSLDLLNNVSPLWEKDGIRLLEAQWSPSLCQVLFSTLPNVSPIFLAQRAKGRLDKALRDSGHSLSWSRKVAVRSIGKNNLQIVQQYIRQQVASANFVDPRFGQQMRRYTFQDPQVVHAEPTLVTRGRYWYDLHLVLVNADGFVNTHESTLEMILAGVKGVGAEQSIAISNVSIMPDHLHLALRPAPDLSPKEVASLFLNGLVPYSRGNCMWRETYYAGTFGIYSMQGVRKKLIELARLQKERGGEHGTPGN